MGRDVTVELTGRGVRPIEREAIAIGRTPAEVIGATVRHMRLARIDGRRLQRWRSEPAQVSGPITAAEVERRCRGMAERIAAQDGRSPEEIIADMHGASSRATSVGPDRRGARGSPEAA